MLSGSISEDRGVELEVDDVAVDDPRREPKLDAEGAIGDRDAAVVVDDRDREFATGEEAGFLARERDEVRFRERAHEPLGFGGLQGER